MTEVASRTLLIVEDDLALQNQIRWSLSQFDCVTADDRSSALLQMRKSMPAVVAMDLGLPPQADGVTEGFLLLKQLLVLDPDVKVIVLTGQNDQANALRAIALGANDFFAKPFVPELLAIVIERAFYMSELQRENRRLQAVHQPDVLSGLITRDPDMLKLCRMIEKVGPSNASIMLLGESGTGKELLARALHKASPRRVGKFVGINCAAIPENLLESELFGFEKGSFTGAVKTTLGKIEMAHGGTLLLDEIGDLPLALQSKLLRFLQERTIERIGGRREIPVDVRVVCATHRDLNILSKEGRFREDLYYRLAEVVVNIPPLRERLGDAALLAHAMLRRYAQENNRPTLRLCEEAINRIESHSWPGNIRELENRIKRAAIMAEGSHVTCEDLDLPPAQTQAIDTSHDLRRARDRAEKATIIAAMGRANGNVVKAADLLGVSRPTLYDLMHRLSLK